MINSKFCNTIMFYCCFMLSCNINKHKDFLIDSGIRLENVEIGSTIKNGLLLKNETMDTVFIDTMYVSCSCVKLDNYIRSIPPNTTTKLKYTFWAEDSGYVVRGIFIKLRNQHIPHQYKIEAIVK